MKKNLLLASALLLATAATAQTEVTAGIMRGKDYGVTYLLPKTEIEIALHITRHNYTPGEFCRYADHYLRMSQVADEPDEYWTLDKIQVHVVGVPDKDKVYFVKLKDKTVAPLMELTGDGIVRSINMPFEGDVPQKDTQAETTANKKRIDPRNFLTEEMRMVGSNAKMAELLAKEIYSIRESKNVLLRGESDNLPKDGLQLKLMLDNLNEQEQAMIEMFTGTVVEEPQVVTVRITPKEMKDEVAFRFSRKRGIVDKNDLGGEPYYISVTDLKTPLLPPQEGMKKEPEGIAYNVPGQAQVTLSQGAKTVFNSELPVTQFGSLEYLAPVLFNKNSAIKVQFDTTTGGLLKIDR